MLSKRKSSSWQSQGVGTGTGLPALGITSVPDTAMATHQGTVLAGKGRWAMLDVGRAVGFPCAHPVLGN